jgi:hypothetical protein
MKMELPHWVKAQSDTPQTAAETLLRIGQTIGSLRSFNNHAIEVPCLPRPETVGARQPTRCSPGRVLT